MQEREKVECNKSGLRGVVVMRRRFGVGAGWSTEGWRRGGCVIVDASQPHLAWGSMGLAAEPARTITHVYAYLESASFRIA